MKSPKILLLGFICCVTFCSDGLSSHFTDDDDDTSQLHSIHSAFETGQTAASVRMRMRRSAEDEKRLSGGREGGDGVHLSPWATSGGDEETVGDETRDKRLPRFGLRSVEFRRTSKQEEEDEEEKRMREKRLPRLGIRSPLPRLGIRAPLPRLGFEDDRDKRLPRLGIRAPLPRLGMRSTFDREADDYEEELEEAQGEEEADGRTKRLPRFGLRASPFPRLGRAAPFPRLGRSEDGKRAAPFPRLGRASPFPRLGRSSSSSADEYYDEYTEDLEERAAPFPRLGRASPFPRLG